MPGLQDLVMALRSGLDPNIGMQLYDRIHSEQQARQDELQAQLEEEQEEQEARRAARQEQVSTLGGMLIEQASGGMPYQASSGLLDAYSALPGMNLNPRMQGGLQDMLQGLYPRQDVPVPGRQQAMTSAREGGPVTAPVTRPGPRGTSPLFVAPPPEAQDPSEVLADVQATQELAGIASGQGPPIGDTLDDDDRTYIAGVVNRNRLRGEPPEAILGILDRKLLQMGALPDERNAAAQLAMMMLQGLQPQGAVGAGGTPQQAGPGPQAPARAATFSPPQAGIQNAAPGETWVEQLMDLLGFM